MDGEKMRVLVLLKPGEVQPAMERAAEFARFMPELDCCLPCYSRI